MKGIQKIRLTGKDINVIHLIMREYQPTISVSDVIFGLQVMGMRQNHTAMLSVPEAARMLDTTKYKVQCAAKDAGVKPVSYKKCPGGQMPLYDGEELLRACGVESVEVLP